MMMMRADINISNVHKVLFERNTVLSIDHHALQLDYSFYVPDINSWVSTIAEINISNVHKVIFERNNHFPIYPHVLRLDCSFQVTNYHFQCLRPAAKISLEISHGQFGAIVSLSCWPDPHFTRHNVVRRKMVCSTIERRISLQYYPLRYRPSRHCPPHSLS
jgi:hypothetical protein